jgi:hypothetical protein
MFRRYADNGGANAAEIRPSWATSLFDNEVIPTPTPPPVSMRVGSSLIQYELRQSSPLKGLIYSPLQSSLE